MTSAHHAHTRSPVELTRNQELVFVTLQKADGPLSAYTLLENLRPEGLRAPPQIYRALERLQALGLVHKIETVNAFIACSDPHCGKHHTTIFSICEECGHVSETSDEGIYGRIRDLASAGNFQPSRSTVELHGLCGDCVQKT